MALSLLDSPALDDALLERLPDPTCLVGPDGLLIGCNPLWEGVLGLSVDALRGRSFVELAHPGDRERVAAALERARGGERVGPIESRFGQGEQGARLLSWSAKVHAPSALLYISARDLSVTEIEHRYFKAIVDGTTDFVSIGDGDGRVTYINPAGMEMIGRPGGDYRGMQTSECRTPKGFEHFLREIHPAVLRDGRWVGETEYGHASGAAIPVTQVVFTIADAVGEPNMRATIVRDRSEAMRREVELRRFKALVEGTSDFVAILDVRGTVIYANPAMAALLDCAGQELGGRAFNELCEPETVRVFAVQVWPAVMKRGLWSGEIEAKLWDGATIPLSLVVTRLRDAEGRPEAIAAIARDLSARKKAEALERTIRVMSTPILQVGRGVLALPIIGAVDCERAARMTEDLLKAIVETRARVSILDLTGVEAVDAATVHRLFDMISAASLLGSRAVVSGITPAVARTVTQLGLDWGGVSTFRSLDQALRFAQGRAVDP